MKDKAAEQPRRPLLPKGGNDCVQTPDSLASDIVGYFLPQITGRVLEPCEGDGAFTRAFAGYGIENVTTLEILRGQDFFEFHEHVDWVITNPPWGQIREFLKHSYEIADNVAFLIAIHHVLSMRARIRDRVQAGFGIVEVLYVDTPPKPWPPSGFQLGVTHLKRGYVGKTAWNQLDKIWGGEQLMENEYDSVGVLA